MKTFLVNTFAIGLIVLASSAIAQEAAPVPSMVVEGQIHTMNFVGLVPEGLRLDGHVTGVITDGLFAGATGEWIDYLLIRHDGVGVVYVRGFFVDPDGVPVAFTLRGFLGEPQPELVQAMLDPEYEMPDVDMPVHGAAWFESMAPQYAFLNYTVFGATGTVNPATGVIRAVYRSLAE